MTSQQRLDASWSAFKAAGMLTAATWTSGSTSVAQDVIFDAPGANVFSDVVSIDRSVQYRTAIWPTVHRGDTITIGGTSYRADEPMPVDDGLVARVGLTKL